MSVLSACRLSAVKNRLLVIGASCSCILILAMQAGTGTSHAAVLGGRAIGKARPLAASVHRHTGSSSTRGTCVAGAHHRRVVAKACKAKRSKRSRHRVAKPSKRASGSQSSIASSQQLRSSATIPGEVAPPPQAPPTERPLIKAPPVRTPPRETPPVDVPAVEEPPVETPPVETPPVETPPVETPPVETPPAEPAPFRFFAPTSFWNSSVPAVAPSDPSSEAMVAALNAEVLAEVVAKHGPAINTTSWSVPVYTVPANQPLVSVTPTRYVPAALKSAWSAVPLPANAQPAVGSDAHLVVWQPSTDSMWEFWRLERSGEAWRASWGGAMQGVSGNYGVYGPEAWPGASASWGASASSLPLVGGLITLEDLQMGKINHALAISIPNVRGAVYASPAQRTDGGSVESSSLPEGAHLRLDPTLDLQALHLPRFTLMLAEAAQRYGVFVRDKASNVTFYAEDPTQTGTNPFLGSHGYFEGQSPAKLAAMFPWSHLQVLNMELR